MDSGCGLGSRNIFWRNPTTNQYHVVSQIQPQSVNTSTNIKVVGKTGKRKVVRDRAYFAAAARRSRARKRLIQIAKEKNTDLIEEVEKLKARQKTLEKQFRLLISGGFGIKEYAQALKEENETLKEEVATQRKLRNSILALFSQVDRDMFAAEQSMQLLKLRRDTKDNILNTCSMSMIDDDWQVLRKTRSRFKVGLNRFRAEHRMHFSESFSFREDCFELPVPFELAAKVVKIIGNPQRANKLAKTLLGAHVTLRVHETEKEEPRDVYPAYDFFMSEPTRLMSGSFPDNLDEETSRYEETHVFCTRIPIHCGPADDRQALEGFMEMGLLIRPAANGMTSATTVRIAPSLEALESRYKPRLPANEEFSGHSLGRLFTSNTGHAVSIILALRSKLEEALQE